MTAEKVLLYSGSTAWDWIGRKTAKSAPKETITENEHLSPSIYGPARYIKVEHAITHCSSSHVVLIDDQGVAYTFGRNDKGQLGDQTTTARSTPFRVSLDQKVISAATGRGHTILVTADGKMYGSGDNKQYQATAHEGADVTTFTQIDTTYKIQSVACGAEFCLALTTEGKVLSWGNPQYGQLGDGSEHGYIAGTNRMVYQPQSIKEISIPENQKIVQISCGVNHSFCLDEQGRVYAWGFAGFGRLGLNLSPPKDIMIPTAMSGFVERSNPVKKVAAGPTCGMLIDSRDSLMLWGKWKNSGDGGQGTPWMYPKFFQGLSGWHVEQIAAGGTSLFALADNSTISWGQSCSHGELGHGPDAPRSATNAVKVESLEGIKVTNVSCGLGQTVYVVEVDEEQLKQLPVALELVTEAPEQKDVPVASGKRKAVNAKGPKPKKTAK